MSLCLLSFALFGGENDLFRRISSGAESGEGQKLNGHIRSELLPHSHHRKKEKNFLQHRHSVDEIQLDEVHLEKIQQVCEPLELSPSVYERIMSQFLKCMEEGLSANPEAPPCVKMLPSYVRSVPNGTEKGPFLALDLGGTNFRVLLIRLEGSEAKMVGQIYRIPHDIMVGTGDMLFDHIAESLANFCQREGLKDKLPLGFTFSFPCAQEGLTIGKLITWTKGFKASGVEGQDIVYLLRKACEKRKDIDIDVVALLNDTVGTLMALAHKDNDCQVGVIVGTGTNACYMEKIERCPKLIGNVDTDGPDEMIINTEWGAFGDDGSLDFIFTEFDREIDRNSINPGKQLFEKMISGMYMGELVRLILEKLARMGLLFEGRVSDELLTRGNFPTKFVSEIENDLLEDDRTFANTFNILEDLGLEHISPADCANVAYVCSVVSTRAAFLCATTIAVLLNRMQKSRVTVGVDGSVYRFHPTFKQLLEQKISELIEPGIDFHVSLSEDGSGVGAALVAAVASRINAEKLAKKLSQTTLNS